MTSAIVIVHVHIPLTFAGSFHVVEVHYLVQCCTKYTCWGLPLGAWAAYLDVKPHVLHILKLLKSPSMLEWFLLSRLPNELSTHQSSPNHHLSTFSSIFNYYTSQEATCTMYTFKNYDIEEINIGFLRKQVWMKSLFRIFTEMLL